ncbi:DUF382-domain-containing protein [Hyphopichia burtonii NRRL Y-1933]|uniref:DUF382-domain-containing protein n=1 Tax=Hyphopichia burtonii NRRL Y-1933 TaxID=984485 RepID=A0A1E4RI43_9ASCO|nr:DUF382-domain-containing protein [Hyphopichia burtonii NRRL Y-1933]ODV66948.1 DUF382-domain-containing protein [Hyphopichia burtonii NRRL Y-1933]
MAKEKRSKNQIRREKAKLRKLNETNPKNETKSKSDELLSKRPSSTITKDGDNDTVDDLNGMLIPENDELYSQFSSVFSKFNGSNTEDEKPKKPENETFINDELVEETWDDFDNEDESEDEDEEEEAISKRQLRKINKIPLSSLKASISRPQVVELNDVDAPDPYFLVRLKSHFNTVQVPSHWSSKREYLASKRGIERLPFQLPKFIQDTNIQEMRNTGDDLTLKQQQRERVQPKMGKLDIDYQKLHDAFFKFQTKPRLTGYGDVFFEGKESSDEFINEIMNIKPGKVSQSLRHALGMPENNLTFPPPWLNIMREIGKPPAYEHLIIPGLDCEYKNSGYFVADENGNEIIPLPLDESLWGHPEEGEESEEEEDLAEDDEDEVEEGFQASEEEKDDEQDAEKVEITEYSRIKTMPLTNKQPDVQEDSGPKQLYTILKENTAEGTSDGLLKNVQTYELAQDGKDTTISSEKEESYNKPTKQRKEFKF